MRLIFNIKIKLNSNPMSLSHVVPTHSVHYTHIDVPTVVHHAPAELSLFSAQLVALYTVLSTGPFLYEACTLLALNAKIGSNSLWLGLCSIVFMMLGAAVGAYVTKVIRNLPRVIGIGVLLLTPFMFAFWNCLDNAEGAESWFWTGLWTLSLASFGFGMLFAGTVAYLGKTYRASLNPHTGKVVGTFFWYAPLSAILT